MKAVKLLCLTALFMGSMFQVSGQGKNVKHEKKERVKQLKIAYFTEKLNLTVAESEKFWPVYNEMNNKLHALRKETKNNIKKLSERKEEPTDAEIKKSTYSVFDLEAQEASVKKEGFDKLSNVVGVKKAAKTFKLEREFKKTLLKELHRKHEVSGPPRPPMHHDGQKGKR